MAQRGHNSNWLKRLAGGESEQEGEYFLSYIEFSCSETRASHVAKASLELRILLLYLSSAGVINKYHQVQLFTVILI